VFINDGKAQSRTIVAQYLGDPNDCHDMIKRLKVHRLIKSSYNFTSYVFTKHEGFIRATPKHQNQLRTFDFIF